MLSHATINEAERWIEGFQCEDAPDVVMYLRLHAAVHHRQNLTCTRLFFNESGKMVGYFTILTDLVEIGIGKRRDMGWDLDERIRHFPAIKLHYLAVDSRYRNRGYGSKILAHVMHLCAELACDVGARLS